MGRRKRMGTHADYMRGIDEAVDRANPRLEHAERSPVEKLRASLDMAQQLLARTWGEKMPPYAEAYGILRSAIEIALAELARGTAEPGPQENP